MNIQILRCSSWDLLEIMRNVREADKIEAYYFLQKKYPIEKAFNVGLMNCYLNGESYVGVDMDKGTKLMVFGFAGRTVWAAAHKLIETPEYRKTFIKECLARVKPVLAGHGYLTNYVWEGNTKAVLWLKKIIGAEIIDTAIFGGERFHKFILNKDKENSLLMGGDV